tara:strand:- start:102 stop:398 length:297 start_codon:yes stop_codon:yes gene_type:complete
MSRYKNTGTSIVEPKSGKKKNSKFTKLNTTIYSVIPEVNEDIYVITQPGDRLDLLAYQFYNDSKLWWYIARANNLKAMNVAVGTRLRIPISTQYAVGK